MGDCFRLDSLQRFHMKDFILLFMIVTGQKSAEGRESSGMLLGKGLKAVWYGDIHGLW